MKGMVISLLLDLTKCWAASRVAGDKRRHDANVKSVYADAGTGTYVVIPYIIASMQNLFDRSYRISKIVILELSI